MISPIIEVDGVRLRREKGRWVGDDSVIVDLVNLVTDDALQWSIYNGDPERFVSYIVRAKLPQTKIIRGTSIHNNNKVKY